MRALGARGVPGLENPYERLKELTRGHHVTGEDLRTFVKGLGLPPEVAERLAAMTPQTYVGAAPELVDYLDEVVPVTHGAEGGGDAR
jgi:adenylosuccinate lyase